MARTIFHIISALVAIAIVAAVYFSWPNIVEAAATIDEGNATIFAGFGVGLVLFGLLVLYGFLKDAFFPRQRPGERELTEAERQAAAAQNAQAALDEGRPQRAIQILETAGLFVQAAKVAQEHGDKVALARLSLKAGNFDRARRICLELNDTEGAARAATLMGDIETAHDYYRTAAVEREKDGAKAKELAPLYDRACDWEKAATLYEQAGDFVHAAECFLLCQDTENYRRCKDHADAFMAYEKRRGLVDRDSDSYKKQKAEEALELDKSGDFLGAGFSYRDAGHYMEAGMAFDRYEEWERAANSYNEVGMQDRAELSLLHLKEKPRKKRAKKSMFDAGEAPKNAPDPASLRPSAFQPLTHIQYAPAFNMPAIPAAEVAAAQERVAQRVRRGEFKEAAEFAEKAGDLLMAAALSERAGELVKAADLYRKVGKAPDAAFCLERAHKPVDAAKLILAEGDDTAAIDILMRAIAADKDPEIARLLIYLLVRSGRHDEAIQHLRERFAPPPIDANNAMAWYSVGRMLERFGGNRHALSVYREMLDAGAVGRELQERQQALADLLAAEPGGGGLAPWPDPAKPRPAETFQFRGPDGDVTDISLPSLSQKAVSDTMRGVAGQAEEMSLFGAPPEAQAAPETQDDPFSSGQRYELLREIARGGMGIVYEAEDTALGRKVAFKVIQSDAVRKEEIRQFLLEARATARLNHPNVVTIFDIGLYNLKHYITMEFIGGGTLSSWVEMEGRLPLAEALRVFAECSRGLQAAHHVGIVHRDIKPGNILMNERHEVKIVDFGLAKLAKGREDGDEKSLLSVGAGTPGYMAPEQARGGDVLPRADIYALGMTLFYMLVGAPPHRIAKRTGALPIITYQLEGNLPSIQEFRQDVPDCVEQLYRYCTALDVESRYQSVESYLSAVEEWLVSMNTPAAVG